MNERESPHFPVLNAAVRIAYCMEVLNGQLGRLLASRANSDSCHDADRCVSDKLN
jgi:hypothetical protein